MALGWELLIAAACIAILLMFADQVGWITLTHAAG